jgi:hypothetical protein
LNELLTTLTNRKEEQVLKKIDLTNNKVEKKDEVPARCAELGLKELTVIL